MISHSKIAEKIAALRASLKNDRQSWQRYGRHALFVTVEILAVGAVLLACVGAVTAWRLSTGPMDVNFATGYIEQALQNSDRGTYATIGDAVLEWPDLQGPLILNVRGLKFFTPRGHLIMSMDNATLKLSRAALLIGRVVPVGLVFEKPEIHIVRRENGRLNIGFFARRQQQADTEAQKDFTARILQYVARPGTKVAEDEPLATLETFEIRQARISVDDRKTGTSFQLPSADFIFKARDEGLTAGFYESFAPIAGRDSFVRAELLIPWDAKNVYFKFALQNLDANRVATGKIDTSSAGPQQSALVDAELVAILDGNLNPVNVRLLGSSAAGRLMLPGLYKEALPYRNLAMKAIYNDKSKKLVLSDTHVTTKEVTLKLDAALQKNEDSLTGPMMVSIDQLPQARITPLWPEVLKHEKAKAWITEKISGVTYHDLFAAMNISLQKDEDGWDVAVADVHAGFDFENMKADYRPPMIPVTEGRGKGTFNRDKDTLRIDISSARLDSMKVKKGTIEITKLIGEGQSEAHIDLDVEGPVAGGLNYLSKEPVSLKHDFDIAKVQGNAAANVRVNFPTSEDIPLEAVKVEAEGTMSNVFLPGVMNKLDLSGGAYTIAVKDNEFILKGSGQLDGGAVTIDYREVLHGTGAGYQNKITAQLVASPTLRNKLGLDLSDFTQDNLPVDVVYTKQAGGAGIADLKINLTPAQLVIAPFNYDKKPGAAAEASLKAKLENGVLKEVNDFKITAPNLTIDKTVLGFSQKTTETKLASAEIPAFKIGDTQGKLNLTVDNSGIYKVTLDADYFNLAPFIEDRSPPSGDSTPLQLNLSARRLGMANAVTFGPSSLYLEKNVQGRFERFEFNADSGKGPVDINFKPDSATGQRVFNMSAEDAGYALRAFGVYENMRGGALKIRAWPVAGPQDRTLAGKAEIRNFTVVQAPTLARLLGALSLPGVLSLLSNEGLSFTNLEADFKWLALEQQSLITFKDGRTSGNAMGLTFDGSYDRASEKIDVEGTIVPLSDVNTMISNIPLVGEILAGGSDSIFAATYTVRGNAENPEVMVNPLAVLAPGILRRILFE